MVNTNGPVRQAMLVPRRAPLKSRPTERIALFNEDGTLFEGSGITGEPSARASFLDRHDGPVVADDLGVPFTVTGSSASKLAIVDGHLTFSEVTEAQTAYVLRDLGGSAKLVGSRFQFTPGGDSGGLMIGAFANKDNLLVGGSPCHLVITPWHWELGVVVNSTISVIRSREFSNALPFNQLMSFEAVIDQTNGVIYVIEPDGTVIPVRDPLIRVAPQANFAAWQLSVYSVGDAVAEVAEVWSDSKSNVDAASEVSTTYDRAAQGSSDSLVGTQYQRPPSSRGGTYMDLTLGKPVFADGSKWVDVSGARVGNLIDRPLALITRVPLGLWAATATVSQESEIHPVNRTRSLKFVSTAAGDPYALVQSPVPVTAGKTYSAAVGSFRAAGTARNFVATISYFDAGGNYVIAPPESTAKSSGSTVWTPSNIVTSVAPATAVKASPGFTVKGVAAAGEVFHATEFCLADGVITGFIEP